MFRKNTVLLLFYNKFDMKKIVDFTGIKKWDEHSKKIALYITCTSPHRWSSLPVLTQRALYSAFLRELKAVVRFEDINIPSYTNCDVNPTKNPIVVS